MAHYAIPIFFAIFTTQLTLVSLGLQPNFLVTSYQATKLASSQAS